MSHQDEKIEEEVRLHLDWDGRFNAEKIQVSVEDGEVTLRGAVPTYPARKAAVADAWAVLGVVRVHDELQVEHEYPERMPGDEEIKQEVAKVLKWNVKIDESDIAVSVEDGVVTLEGSVDAFWKKRYVEELISDLMGVTGIKNKLAVVLGEEIVDRIIAEDVMAALDRNMNIDAERINVSVKDGVVSLSGTVDSWAAGAVAYEAARCTVGVVDVENNLTVVASA